MDVVKNYDIDGVHFDDYFYPQEVNGVKIEDEKLWKHYLQVVILRTVKIKEKNNN